MSEGFMFRSRIAGTGAYLPEKVLSNYDLEKMVETSHEWIVERTGIVNRHVVSDNETTSDICLKAAQNALANANLNAQDIDMILLATVTGDLRMPSTACLLQAKLGCRNIMAFDLAAACTGFLYGLTIADQFIRTGHYKNILVVGAESLSRVINYKDRETCILFGDGAGAWVISQADANDKNVILSSHMHAEGSLAELLWMPAGGTKEPITREVLDRDGQYMIMKGKEIFKNAVRTMVASCHEALEANNMKSEQVDWLIPHQANLRILESVANYFEFPKEKVAVGLHETGNTSAASIPLVFDMYLKQGQIKRGQTLLLTAFGAGLTSGSLLLKF